MLEKISVSTSETSAVGEVQPESDSTQNSYEEHIDEIKEFDEDFLNTDETQSDPILPDLYFAGNFEPIEKYVAGLRIKEFPKPLLKEFQWLQSYQSWHPEDDRRLTKIDSGDKTIWSELLEIVQIEGPILGSYLMRRHYKATGGSSLSSSKEALYLRQIKHVINRGELRVEDQPKGESLSEATFRLETQEPVITRVRGPRDLYEVPPRELAMIIRAVMKSRKELSNMNQRELLFRQTLLLLDFTKLTKKAEEHLNRIFVAYTTEILK